MPARSTFARQHGFSLIELLIGMLIAVEILVAALTIFDVHNRLARVQLQVTDMQQSVRVAQYDMVRTTRMAGRGGLPGAFHTDTDDLSVPWLRGLAVEARDNVADGGDNYLALGTEEPQAVPGTDILTVRGCLSDLLFQILPNAGDYDSSHVTIRKALSNGRTQEVGHLLDEEVEGPLLFRSATDRDRYAVAEVTNVAGDDDAVTFSISYTSAVDPPNPLVAAPAEPFLPQYVCVLEEYRYYVRRNFETPGDSDTRLKPRLSRARMIPGTELPYSDDAANLSLDLADDIIDLQIALAFDTDYDSAASGAGSFDDDNNDTGPDDLVYEGADDDARATDDWLGNSTADDPEADPYRINAHISGRPAKPLFVRITTIGRTSRPDPRYFAPDFEPTAGSDLVENNDYDAEPASLFKQGENRNYRHRVLQTVVALRNL